MSEEMKRQYATSRNLAARGTFQSKYANVDWFSWLSDTMSIHSGADILDVGCGPAWFWRTQANRLPTNLTLTLLDYSPGMIEEAKANLSKTKSIEISATYIGDAVALPFPDNSFDIVLLLHVLYHVSDPEKALLEARRVLRPGGRVYLSANDRNNMNELHTLGSMVFGGDAVDPGARQFSLSDGETLVSELFVNTHRSDLTDILECTDPNDAVAFLLSMPPGNDATDEECEELKRLILDRTAQGFGVLKSTRRNGIVEGFKPT